MHKPTLVGAVALALASGLAAQRMIAVDSSRALYNIDINTGAKTQFGTVSVNASTTAGLAYDAANDIMYLTSTGNDSLFTLDLATGTATLIGFYGDAAIVMHGLEYDSSTGVLYGVSQHNNGLYNINKSTGVATLIGTSGLTSFTNLGHNSHTNVMYATNSGTDSFYVMNRATGGVTLLGPLLGPTNPNGLAFNTDNGRMYLVDNSTDNFYSINMVNGVATLIGSTGVGNLLGLAYLPGPIHDNGPILTPPLGGGSGGANISVVQTLPPHNLNIFGFTGNAATFRLADDFHLDGPGGTSITQVEVFAYQTGSTTTSTFDGLFVEITAGDPSAGGLPVAGSPGFATNLVTSGLVSNEWTGIYRVLDTTPLDANRPIMAVRCRLPAPVVLSPGTNSWLTFTLTGTLASGPFIPPITILNAPASGNAKQFTVGSGTWASIVSGVHAQGIPFRLYGHGQTAGGISFGVAGCNGAGLTVAGSPNLGGVLRVEMTNLSLGAIPILGFDFSTTAVVVCNNGVANCVAGHNFGFSFFFLSATTLQVPVDTGLFGVLLACQGAEVGGVGACVVPGIAFTNSLNVTLQN